MNIAGHPVTIERVRYTITLLRWFRAFLNSDCERAVDPHSGWMRTEFTKEAAKRRLHTLIEVAINRKAGIPDEPSGKGNRWKRRLQATRNAIAECDWCGQLTGSTTKRFCCKSCQVSYS